jgi:hypothetical protein
VKEPTLLQKAAILWLMFATGVTGLITLILLAGLIHTYPVQSLYVIVPAAIILTAMSIAHLIRS